NEAQLLAKGAPIDIAFVCMKSYDTGWATALIKQYLAPGGYVVSLQNCMNEETIAGIVGWGKTLGSIASSITVELHAPGQVRRAAGKSGSKHTVFRVGEVHGRITDRAKEVCGLLANADSAFVTENLWGERWSKLVTNVMGKGRRTEIPFLNGFVVRKGEEVGIPAPTNAILTDIVHRVEIGELKPDPKHITDLRLN